MVSAALLALAGCEEAGTLPGDDDTDLGGDGGGTDAPLPGEPLTVSGTVASQRRLDTFELTSYTGPSDEITFFIVDSDFSYSIVDTDTSSDYSFSLTIPVPESEDLVNVPSGVTSSDSEAAILVAELYGAREDAIIYEYADPLGFGLVTGSPGPDSSVVLDVVAYVYSDRDTTLSGTDGDGVVYDDLELVAGWNEVRRTVTLTFDIEAVLSDVSQSVANGTAPDDSEWILFDDPLRVDAETWLDENSTAIFHAYDSSASVGSEYADFFLRDLIQGEVVDLFLPGDPQPDVYDRELLLYLLLDDGDNTDGSLTAGADPPTRYSLNGSDGTDLIDVFILVYSTDTEEQITAGVGEDTTDFFGVPMGNYLQIDSGYVDIGTQQTQEAETFEYSFTTVDGETITGFFYNYNDSPNTFDYAAYGIYE